MTMTNNKMIGDAIFRISQNSCKKEIAKSTVVNPLSGRSAHLNLKNAPTGAPCLKIEVNTNYRPQLLLVEPGKCLIALVVSITLIGFMFKFCAGNSNEFGPTSSAEKAGAAI